MPVGDFPTVFPTIMTCRLNRMVTSKNCIIHKRYCICSNTLLVFIDHVCFADHEHVFWVNTCIFRICIFTIRCCIFSAYHDIVYCSWKDLFAIYMHMLQICSTIYSTWKTRDGRKCVKNFVVLGCFSCFRTKLIGLECPSGIFPRYPRR